VKVTVKLFATFRDFLPRHAVRSGLGMDVAAHGTVRGLIKALSLPEELPRIILVNGQYASEDSLLNDGDTVSIFPPLIGGRDFRLCCPRLGAIHLRSAGVQPHS
jgi:molybdopterin synthase sulfur carrier subunit